MCPEILKILLAYGLPQSNQHVVFSIPRQEVMTMCLYRPYGAYHPGSQLAPVALLSALLALS